MELIISIEYFEQFTIIDTDFDSNKVNNHLVDAQEIQTTELLGVELYDRIQLALQNPTTDPDADALALKLKPFVLKATELNLVPFLNKPVTAKGTQDRSGNFSTSASGTDQGLILDNIRAKVEYHALRIREFLNDNSTKYPEYRNDCNGNNQNFYSTIHLV